MHLCGEKKIASVGRESGQSMIESIICMFVILLLLFSFLELFNLSLARMVTDHASMTAARCEAVGLKPYLAIRRAQCAAIPASGRRTYPDSTGWVPFDTSQMTASEISSRLSSLGYEKSLINCYIVGTRWLDYEYWNGDNSDTNSIYNDASTSLEFDRNVSDLSKRVEWQVRFDDYPSYSLLNMFFSGHSNFLIKGENAVDVNYASQFLKSN